jgi:hypothetical protein
MSSYSAAVAPHMLWPAVAHAYRKLAAAITMTRAGTSL